MDFAAAAVREPEELLPSEGCRTLKFPRDERLCEKKIQLLDTGTGQKTLSLSRTRDEGGWQLQLLGDKGAQHRTERTCDI